MAPAPKNFLEGALTLAGGTALWLLAGDIEIPFVNPVKTGMVVACLGVVQLLYAGYLGLNGSRRSKG
ncbi:hypothetical protein HUT19_29210 [Streptomyces sp. NA02950]|uniref:DUF5708 family protein n=1 Tax=Streptomyces sp. NA02950 TaxID=2742137 RepID=UPI001591EC79|nr:DUF5708 family protein [Streptomyces sp. NA02950]QKV95303.1 hypothetical protein HUT19_29210 [Streptomyces sp. NA02950]